MAVLGALLCALDAGAARADAIDGDWCFGTSSLSIHGSEIKTPGGSTLAGTYSRHSFAYTVPAGEAGAGAAISMRLLNEELMTLTRGDSAPEQWRRCKPVS